jgi:UDP-glucose 4-epimerase
MYLVTGAAGYLGHHVAQELAHRGRKVRMFDVRKPQVAGHSVEFMKGAVTDMQALRRALRDVRVIFHCSEERTDDPFIAAKANSLGTLTVLEAARKADVHKVIYSSTAEVYGDARPLPWKESQTPIPVTPYAVTKLQGEYYARAFSSIHGLETVSLRYTDVYGPGFGIGREKPTVPDAVRDHVHISDVAYANIAAVRGRHYGDAFNIGSGESHSGREIIEFLRKAGIRAKLGVKTDPLQVNISLAKRSLG